MAPVKAAFRRAFVRVRRASRSAIPKINTAAKVQKMATFLDDFGFGLDSPFKNHLLKGG
jgi:hypothetical protein